MAGVGGAQASDMACFAIITNQSLCIMSVGVAFAMRRQVSAMTPGGVRDTQSWTLYRGEWK